MRFEDLKRDFHGHLSDSLISAGMTLDGLDLQEIERATSFETRSGGRKPGEAKDTSHRRKGIVGDWKNHFDSDLTASYTRQYGELTHQLGYA